VWFRIVWKLLVTSRRNPDANDGLWKIGNRRQAVYARRDLPERDRIAAARSFAGSV